MSVQTRATARNQQAELMISFILRSFAQNLHQNGYIASATEQIPQLRFEQDDCCDVFDHYLEIDLLRPVGCLQGPLQIWVQLTCYKGNETGKPESNKTYEIRETLTEGLGLRRWLRQETNAFRTVHFTVGPSAYTYGWFETAKKCAYDLSLYPDDKINCSKLFQELKTLSNNIQSEESFYRKLEQCQTQPDSHIGLFINDMLKALYEWFILGMPTSDIADQQADLLQDLSRSRHKETLMALAASKQGGAGIKSKALKVALGDQPDDAIMLRTMQRLWSKNPFLPAALAAEANWEEWVTQNLNEPLEDIDLEAYIRSLWDAPGTVRLINRRLLLRIHTDDGVDYVQDINVEGLTEHNLYHGNHKEQQVSSITAKIANNYRSKGITRPTELHARLISPYALRILKASRRFEGSNGTNIKPSFFYVEEALADLYNVLPFKATSLPMPISYCAAFGQVNIEPYQNMKVICTKDTNSPLAILKAKYFRKPEFARRVKEEAYVGLTTKFTYHDGSFEERYPKVPLIMFVDMDMQLVPQEYAVRRLVTAGWDVFFSVGSLKEYLAVLVT